MNTLFVKEQGIFTRKEFTDTDLIDWFKENSDAEGNVQQEAVSYTTANIKLEGEGFQWVLSDFTLDRDMERMDPSGWDLKEYKKNPIVLWSHSSSNMFAPDIPAIGMMKNIKKASDEKGQLTGTVVFDESGFDPLAMNIASKVRQGIISKGSVGFMTKVIEITEDARDGTRLIHRKQELIEFSIVNIPANPNAQIQRNWDGELDTNVAQVGALPKDYIFELLQGEEGHETSAGETSDLLTMFQDTIPDEGKSNIKEFFNGKN